MQDNQELRALVRLYLMVGYPKPRSLAWVQTEFGKGLETFFNDMDDLYQEGSKYQLTEWAYERYARNYEINSRRLSCTQ